MKIICIGRNYAEHAAELNNALPKQPLIFMKPSTALLKDGKAFYYPEFSQDIHYELELVVKICRTGKSVAPKFAHKYYEEVGLGIDLTARDLQSKCKENGHPWEIAKAFDHSAIVGRFLPKAEAQEAEGHYCFELQQDGQSVQQGDSRKMITDIDNLIAYVSKFFSLQKGDLIFTGTPAGVGPIAQGQEYKGFLKGQELLSCEIR